MKELTNLEYTRFTLVKNPPNPHAVIISINGSEIHMIKKEDKNDKS